MYIEKYLKTCILPRLGKFIEFDLLFLFEVCTNVINTNTVQSLYNNISTSVTI